MSDDTTLNVDGLDKLIRALKKEPPKTRVGVLGSKTVRTSQEGASPSNAEIGAAHEFGTTTLPQRSFLRIPISENLQKYMEKSGAFTKEAIQQVLADGSLVPYMKKVATIAEAIVAEAFNTGGFGKWKPSKMDSKKVKQTLVETQQLRNSITSEVKE